MNNKLKKWLLQIFATKIGWLALTLLSAVLFGVLSNWFDWAQLPVFICLIYPFGLTIILIVYAWIINPIKDWKQNKKFKK